jgi:hypothetical protein
MIEKCPCVKSGWRCAVKPETDELAASGCRMLSELSSDISTRPDRTLAMPAARRGVPQHRRRHPRTVSSLTSVMAPRILRPTWEERRHGTAIAYFARWHSGDQ